MKTTAIKMFAFAVAFVATSVGVVPTANADWFTVNPAYGPSGTGVSAPVRAPSYGRAQTVDQNDANHYIRLAELATMPGARTSLFVPELDLLFLAVRRQGPDPAEIRIYRTQ